MKGPSRSLWLRLGVAAIFGVAFVAGAVLVFGLSSMAGTSLIAGIVPARWRLGVAAAALLGLAIFDLFAIRHNRYSLLGWRRQTPQRLIYYHAVPTTAAVWGFDAGLAVTTFRVAAATWGALLLGVLGFASWWSGLAYGIAFSVPLTILMFVQGSSSPDWMKSGRRVMQTASALLLVFCSALLVARIV